VTLRQVFPGAAPVDDLDALYTVVRRPWLRVNLIASVDGRTGGTDGTSASLTMGDDRKVLGAIRRNSDIVVIGAETVRREGFLLPKSVPLAIVTASGDLSGAALPERVAAGRLFVLCPTSVADRISLPGARVVAVDGDGPMAADAIIAALAGLGFDSIVCEGGPSLAGQLISAGLVDELCLSTSPLIVGDGTPLALATLPMTLDCLLVDDAGVSYARWTSKS
jgi:riboflavin biosynthesis pyrimidine reductase